MYSEKVMEHFKHPHNLREIADADGIGKVGNPVCLPPETLIHCNDSLNKIGEINKHNRVLGHDGLYHPISDVSRKCFSGKLVKIKNKLGTSYLTPDHMIYAVKVPKTWWFSHKKTKEKLPAGWYHADQLAKKDLIAYPISKEVRDKDHLLFNNEKKKWDFRSKAIPSKIPLNDDFLRLAGYYLAEGYLKEKVTNTYLSFTFNIKEQELGNNVAYIVKKLFDIEAKTKTIPKKKTLIVEVNNVWITRLFKTLFGKGAQSKRIPHELMLLPAEKQKSLIYGLWKGDGYFNIKRPRAGYTTISRELCQQMKNLLLRQKITPSIYEEEKKIVKGVNHRKSYRIHIGDLTSLKCLAKILCIDFKCSKDTATHSWFDNEYIYTPITDIAKIPYRGDVCNLEVDDCHSYLTESLAVHNCGDLMWVYIKVGKNKEGKEYIEDIGVKTFGCVAAIATSSMITDLARGKTLEEAKKIGRDDIKDALGGLPPIKVHCSNLSADGLYKAIEDFESKKGKK